MKTSDQINEISKALSAAQKEMKHASKDSDNPFFKSKYSDLSSVIDVIREPIGVNGLSFVQDVISDEKGAHISTRILHASGQWIEFGPLTIPLKDKNAHGVGSAITYGKRYALCACLGIVSSEDQDDDGNKAVASIKAEPKKMSVSMKEAPKTPVDQVADNGNVVENTPKVNIKYASDVRNVHVDDPKMITKEQWNELNGLIKQCTTRAQDHLWCTINGMGANWGESFQVIPEIQFIKMKNDCLGNIAKQKKAANEST